MKISTAKGGIQDTLLHELAMPFEEFSEQASCVEIGTKDGAYYIRGGNFVNGSTQRADANLANADLVVLDGDKSISSQGELIDGAPDPALVHEVLTTKNIQHCIYTTHSHRANGEHYNRYRVVVPCHTQNKAELRLAVDHLIGVLNDAGVMLASVDENYRWSQAWYWPRVPNKEQLEDFVHLEYTSGEPLSIEALKPKGVARVDAAKNCEQFNAHNKPVKDYPQKSLHRELIDRFNEEHGFNWVVAKLEANQYKLEKRTADNARLISPNSESGVAGVIVSTYTGDGKVKVVSFHGNDTKNRFGDPYEVYVHFDFAGDGSSAFKSLCERYRELEDLSVDAEEISPADYWAPKESNLPDILLRLPPSAKFLNRVFDWIESHTKKVFPECTQAAVITIAAQAGARIFYGDDDGELQSTNVYLVVIAPSGAGKNYGLKSVKQFSHAAMLKVAEDFTSDAGVRAFAQACPAGTFLVDEFGDKLKYGMKDNGGHYPKAFALLRNIYSSASDLLSPKAVADSNVSAKLQKTIHKPCIGLYAMSTRQQFEDAIPDDSLLENGTLNRFVILVSGGNVTAHKSSRKANDRPQWLVDRVAEMERQNGLLGAVNRDTENPTNLIYLTYCNEGLKALDEFGEFIERWIGANDTRANIASRWRENAMRIAVALSAMEHPSSRVVDLDLLKWSIEFVTYHGINSAEFIADRSGGEGYYGKVKSKALALIRARTHEGDPISLNEFNRCVPARYLKPRDRKELLGDLIESGFIELINARSDGAFISRKPKTLLVALK